MMGKETQYNYMTWQVVEEYIPKKQLMDYRNKFGCFDRRQTGALPIEDVAIIFKQLGYNMTVTDLEHILREVIGVDCRHSSARIVDFQEFIAIMSFVASNCVDENEMHLIFRQFDVDGDGYITSDELRAMLCRLGDDISDAELDEMMKAADIDGDGKVSYQEFVRVMTGSNENARENASNKSKELRPKDLNMNELSTEIDAIAAEQSDSVPGKMRDFTRRRSKDDSDDVFVKRPIKHRRSWFSVFYRRKSSVVRKKKIESRYSCPALIGAYDLQMDGSKMNLEQELSSSPGGSSFRLSSFKKKLKRNSQ